MEPIPRRCPVVSCRNKPGFLQPQEWQVGAGWFDWVGLVGSIDSVGEVESVESVVSVVSVVLVGAADLEVALAV